MSSLLKILETSFISADSPEAQSAEMKQLLADGTAKLTGRNGKAVIGLTARLRAETSRKTANKYNRRNRAAIEDGILGGEGVRGKGGNGGKPHTVAIWLWEQRQRRLVPAEFVEAVRKYPALAKMLKEAGVK